MSSCGYHVGYVQNNNATITNVELSQNNFKVVDKVSGSSTVSYIMGFGGKAETKLLEDAKADMYAKANLDGKARAVVNLTFEQHVETVFVFYIKRTLTVSGHVVEFTN
ncbi:hypothetical protein EP331_08115 [bacterium]|nr:MAG: hypothetical protein EP331_08115 [bacterium]